MRNLEASVYMGEYYHKLGHSFPTTHTSASSLTREAPRNVNHPEGACLSPLTKEGRWPGQLSPSPNSAQKSA